MYRNRIRKKQKVKATETKEIQVKTRRCCILKVKLARKTKTLLLNSDKFMKDGFL